MDNFLSQESAIILKGLSYINNKYYFECHEYLEDYWIECSDIKIKNVYWFFIQFATALYHYQNDNLNGAWGQIIKANKKIEKLEELNFDLNNLNLYFNFSEFYNLFINISKEELSSDLCELSRFTFKNKDGLKI